jgi:hypothetical protein
LIAEIIAESPVPSPSCPKSPLKIEGSRAIEGRIEQPQSQGRRKWNVYRVKVEIDVSVAGQRSTYVFNCIHSGQATVI